MRPRIAFERIACDGGSSRRGGTMMASANATFALLTKRWIVLSSRRWQMDRRRRKYQTAKPHLFCQCVEDNAFHLEARSHSRHPPPVIRSPKIVKKIVKKKY